MLPSGKNLHSSNFARMKRHYWLKKRNKLLIPQPYSNLFTAHVHRRTSPDAAGKYLPVLALLSNLVW
jgi:hypothetical protein